MSDWSEATADWLLAEAVGEQSCPDCTDEVCSLDHPWHTKDKTP